MKIIYIFLLPNDAVSTFGLWVNNLRWLIGWVFAGDIKYVIFNKINDIFNIVIFPFVVLCKLWNKKDI